MGADLSRFYVCSAGPVGEKCGPYFPSKPWAQMGTPRLSDEISKREEGAPESQKFYTWELQGENWRFKCLAVWDYLAIEAKMKPESEAAVVYMKMVKQFGVDMARWPKIGRGA